MSYTFSKEMYKVELRACVQSGLRSLDEVTEQKRCISYQGLLFPLATGPQI